MFMKLQTVIRRHSHHSTTIYRCYENISLKWLYKIRILSADLLETNIIGLLPEALSADVQTVFSDQTSPMGADSAIQPLVSRQPSSIMYGGGSTAGSSTIGGFGVGRIGGFSGSFGVGTGFGMAVIS